MFGLILLGKPSFDHAYKKQHKGLAKTKGIYMPYLLQLVFTWIFFFQIKKPPWFLQEPGESIINLVKSSLILKV
jgi:hypothetical protein